MLSISDESLSLPNGGISITDLMSPEEERQAYTELERRLAPRQLVKTAKGYKLTPTSVQLPSTTLASSTSGGYIEQKLGGTASLTHKEVVLGIVGEPEEILTMTLVTTTKVSEILDLLQAGLGFPKGSVSVVIKQGAFWKKQKPIEEIGRKAMLKGIKSFTRRRREYPHPHLIIGAGHLGMKIAYFFVKHGQENFVVCDRRHCVGGSSWLEQANDTSKLQTEMGVYHLDFDWGNPEPMKYGTWPSTAMLLEHYHEFCDQYGILPHIRFNTNVKDVVVNTFEGRTSSGEVVRDDESKRYYSCALEPVSDASLCGADRAEVAGKLSSSTVGCEMLDVASVALCPGNLNRPVKMEYKGEDSFGGPIVYGIKNAINYEKVGGKPAVVVGHGAFAVENLRTCLEHGASKVFLVCRRANLASGRICSWAINASNPPLSGATTMAFFNVMYELIGIDPWGYHSVFTNQARSQVTIRQKSRFGIGDVYFLSLYMGVSELVIGSIKRCSPGAIHLYDGRTIECCCILKLLGYKGEFDNDRLLKITEMVGNHINGDARRFVWSEPPTVDAANFGGTSFAPAAYANGLLHTHMVDYPQDFEIVRDELPTHKASRELDQPAYVLQARMATVAAMVYGQIPYLAEVEKNSGELKRIKQLKMHPLKEILAEAAADWDKYGKLFKERGAPGEIPPFPFTSEILQRLYVQQDKDVKESIARQTRRER